MARINTGSLALAVEDAYAPRQREDPYDYAANNQKLHIFKFADVEHESELAGIQGGKVALKTYRQTYTCIAGLNVGDPVYISANNTATLALSTTDATSRVVGYCRYKPTTTTCYIDHFRYVSGLAGLTAGSAVYLTDAGAVSATAGTVLRIIGIAISVTEAILFASSTSSFDAVNKNGIFIFPEVDLKTNATTTLNIAAGKLNLDEVGVRLTTLGGTITGQPTLSWGITGTNAKYKAATVMTNLTAVGKRERFGTLLGTDDAEVNLTFTVTNAATGSSTIKGTPYVKGFYL